ncbi:MAG: hypothetical protein DELT_01070 [Desulfovibrio sp.]
MLIAFIGFGEVAYCISKGLREELATPPAVSGYDVAFGSGTAYEATLKSRAAEVGATLHTTVADAVKGADVVFSAVQGGYALDAGKSARDALKKGALYIDLTTANPKHKLELEKYFAEKGIGFVDSAMLGPLPLYKHKVPMLISGSGVKEAESVMRDLNMKVTSVAGEAGSASKIKLIRSVYMKGLQALLVETFLFAHKAGVEDVVLDSISGTMSATPFPDTVKRLVTADLIHAERRAHEVEESIDVMKDMGVAPLVSAAVVKRLQASAALGYREELGGKAPGALDDVFALWDKKNYE